MRSCYRATSRRFLGQENLLNSSVLIVGCGGLGCPVIQYLAAAGVGRIGLVDFDTGTNSKFLRIGFPSDSLTVSVIAPDARLIFVCHMTF